MSCPISTKITTYTNHSNNVRYTVENDRQSQDDFSSYAQDLKDHIKRLTLSVLMG